MAHISKRPSGNWQVRWQDPDGRSRARTVPTKRAAQALLIDVEEAVGRGHRWEPRDAREVPLLGVIAEQYIRSCALRLRPRTLRRYAENLEVFLRFVVATKRDPYHASLLSKPLLEDFYGWLLEPANGLHGRQRSADTARKIVEVAQLMWAWAEDSDRWPDQIPRPRKIHMVRKRPRGVRAPTWEEMDACVGAATGWQRKLLTVLRYTGLRVGEAMQLEVGVQAGAFVPTWSGRAPQQGRQAVARSLPLDILGQLANKPKRSGRGPRETPSPPGTRRLRAANLVDMACFERY